MKPLIGWRWPAFAIVISAAMLGAAHGFERFDQLYPCPLCLRQREVYWALIAMSAVGLVLWRLRPAPRFIEGLNILVGLVFVTGAGVAAYHIGVEMGLFPSGCAGLTPEEAAREAMKDPLGGLDDPQATGSCSEAATVFGVSMATWNFLISLCLAAVSFAVARETDRATRNRVSL
ncbi:MAG: disulfide bond formation protein B [Pseudomonadota bacterium]